MKNIIKHIKSLVAFTFVGAAVTACSLDMLPLNEVVLEKYWTNKSDVESVVASCYTAMQAEGYIANMIVWGESRSDNVVAGPQVTEDLKNLLKGNIKTTNGLCDWAAMYNVINRCNTVLEYAPQVAEIDPNYTQSDLRVNIAECKALRAISYLTLIKTFKNVPFSFKASVDESAIVYDSVQTFENIIDALIVDIESCKDWAQKSYSTDYVKSTGRITRPAMYALLAELYLWKASNYNLTQTEQNTAYRKCVECCDYVIDYKTDLYKNEGIEGMTLSKIIDQKLFTKYGYPLLEEENTSNVPNATELIFCDGNSFESIFEITFKYGSQTSSNTGVSLMYGGYTKSNEEKTYLTANDKIMKETPASDTYNDTKLFGVYSDYRSITSFKFCPDGGDQQIYKYVLSTNSAGNSLSYGKVSATTYNAPTSTQSIRSSFDSQYENWIIYRLTEIMLFKAEAEIELAGFIPESTTSTERDSLFDDAFNLISAVYCRSNPAAIKTPKLAPARASFKTLGNFRSLLMNERRREFLFEGKRYFDLVRYSRRANNTNYLREALTDKYSEASKAAVLKLVQMDFMYMPIHKKQMQLNPNLVQNPCYYDEEETVKN